MTKFTLALGLTASLVATVAQAQSNLTAETGPQVSVPGASVLSLAEAASKDGVAEIQVATGQTLTNSIQNLAEGKTDISAAPFLLTFLLSRGAGPYSALGPEKGAELAGNISVLYTYRFGTYALSAYESKGFSGWDAVEGATIYNGPPRGAALSRARSLITLTTGLEDGKGYTGVQVNWGQSVTTITDGSADAHVLPLNFPDGRHSQAASSGAMVVFSMPKAAFESEGAQKYMKAPGSVGMARPIDGDIFGPGISVVSEDETFRGIAEVGGEIVQKSMDEETAYRLTKAFLDNLDLFEGKAPFMPTVWLGETETAKTGMCGPITIKYHPGAVRAWEEAGYTLPDCAKP